MSRERMRGWQPAMLVATMLVTGVLAYAGARVLTHHEPAATPGAPEAQPATKPASQPAAPPSAEDGFARYVGQWSSHAVSLKVTADGHGTVDWREYGDGCSSPTKCAGHATLSMGLGHGHLEGIVESSTRETDFRTGDVFIMMLGDGGTATLYVGSRPEKVVLCGPEALPGACGA